MTETKIKLPVAMQNDLIVGDVLKVDLRITQLGHSALEQNGFFVYGNIESVKLRDSEEDICHMDQEHTGVK